MYNNGFINSVVDTIEIPKIIINPGNQIDDDLDYEVSSNSDEDEVDEEQEDDDLDYEVSSNSDEDEIEEEQKDDS